MDCLDTNSKAEYIMTVWSRPFYMLFTEPIVAWLSAVSGFSDALIFTFLRESLFDIVPYLALADITSQRAFSRFSSNM